VSLNKQAEQLLRVTEKCREMRKWELKGKDFEDLLHAPESTTSGEFARPLLLTMRK
jgi:hypothetical protein